MIRNTELSSMKYSICGLLAVLALLIVTTGCSSKPKPATTNFVVTSLDAQRLGYTPRWAINLLVDPDQELAFITPLGDTIVTVEHPSNVITVIDANNGQLLWRKKWVTDAQTLFEPNRLGNHVIVNSDREVFHMDARTGRLNSVSRMEDQVNDGPMITDTLAIFGSNRGRVFAHDLVTGHSRWANELASGIDVRPIVAGNGVFVADIRGTFALFESESGDRLWTGRTFGKITSRPVYSNTTQLIYLASEDQNVYAINRSTGKDRWIYRTSEPIVNDLILLGNTLFVTQSTGLTALDAITGNVVWTIPHKYQVVDLIDQRLIVNSGVYLMMLDVTNGKTIREIPFIERVQDVKSALDDSLIVVTPKGRMVRLDPHR